MRKIFKSTAICAALMSASFYASAELDKKGVDKSEKYSITQSDIKAVPELSDNVSVQAGSLSMRCLVDTPAWDLWGTGYCFSTGSARTATAYFQIDNAPSNYTVIWSDTRCSGTSLSCALPIRQYQTIKLDATVLNNSNNTFEQTSATAHYEGLF